jgi:hypothetical protein
MANSAVISAINTGMVEPKVAGSRTEVPGYADLENALLANSIRIDASARRAPRA